MSGFSQLFSFSYAVERGVSCGEEIQRGIGECWDPLRSEIDKCSLLFSPSSFCNGPTYVSEINNSFILFLRINHSPQPLKFQNLHTSKFSILLFYQTI